MNLSIKLDQKALDTLFPEGSEARVKLQNGVVSAFTKTIMAQHVPVDVKAYVEQEIKTLARDVTDSCRELESHVIRVAEQEMGVVTQRLRNSYGRPVYEVRLTDETKTAIDTATRDSLNDEMREQIGASLNTRIAALVQPGGAYDNYIEATVRRIFEKEIMARVQAALAPINVKGQ